MLKVGKALGPDNIPPEVLEADPNPSSDNLYGLFGKIWKNEETGLSIRAATCNTRYSYLMGSYIGISVMRD